MNWIISTLIWMMIGIVLNMTVSYRMISRLAKACNGDIELFKELYSKHFENGESLLTIENNLINLAVNFIATQIFWPINVGKMVKGGRMAVREAKKR